MILIVTTFVSCKDDSVSPVEDITTANDWNIELLPGQTFEGGYFYFSNTQYVGSISDINNVSWLTVDQSSFTVGPDCSHRNHRMFNFTAPTTVGDYITKIKHSGASFFNTKIILKVTSTPTLYTNDSTVFVNLGDTVTTNSLIQYVGFDIDNCSEYYVPAATRRYHYETTANVDWLEITPNDTTISLNNSGYIKRSFIGRNTGTYTVKEVRYSQYSSFPSFKNWTIVVN